MFSEQKIFENVRQLSPFFEELLHSRLAALPHVLRHASFHPAIGAHTYIHSSICRWWTSATTGLWRAWRWLRCPTCPRRERWTSSTDASRRASWYAHHPLHTCLALPWTGLSVSVCIWCVHGLVAGDGVDDRAVSAAGEREEAPGADGGHLGRRHHRVRRSFALGETLTLIQTL